MKFRTVYLIIFLLISGLVAAQCVNIAPQSQPAPANDQTGLDSELSVYNWADYIDEELLTKYQETYGVEIIYDTFASNEDLLAKLQAGASGYDVIFPSDYMIAQMIDLGLLAEIDHANIPNLKHIDPFFLDNPYDPGSAHCAPYQWGTSGIGYNIEHFGDNPPDSLAVFFDPDQAKQFSEAGGINLLNDQRELIGAALKYLGYSLNDTEEAHLEEAKDLILAVKPFIKSFNSEDYDDSLLVPGEVIISEAWSGDVAQAYYNTYNESTGTGDWGYAIPKEGGSVYQEGMCVPATSTRKATAEHFINFILDPQNSAAITNYTYYASANKSAQEFINEEILNDPGIYPPPEVMANLEWFKPMDEAVFLYDRIWTEIKSK